MSWSHYQGNRRHHLVSPKRAWRLRDAMSHASRLRNLSGMALEVLLGHTGFCFLVRRCLLSVMDHVNSLLDLCDGFREGGRRWRRGRRGKGRVRERDGKGDNVQSLVFFLSFDCSCFRCVFVFDSLPATQEISGRSLHFPTVNLETSYVSCFFRLGSLVGR